MFGQRRREVENCVVTPITVGLVLSSFVLLFEHVLSLPCYSDLYYFFAWIAFGSIPSSERIVLLLDLSVNKIPDLCFPYRRFIS